MNFDEVTRREARLIILRGLAEQGDFSLSDALLQPLLAQYGINKSRAYVIAELGFLNHIGAVRLRQAGSITIATLLERGQDHVERRAVLDGVKPRGPEA